MTSKTPSDPVPRGELAIRALRLFLAVEETGSIHQAAVRLGQSVSGVSQSITALEKTIGAKVFDRSVKPIVLTAVGALLAPHARHILAAVAHAQIELAEMNLSGLPALNIAIIDDLDVSLTPVLVGALQKRFDKCAISATSGRSDEVISRLEIRQADIGVTALLPVDDSAFTAEVLLTESFILVAARGRLKVNDRLLEQLSKVPFIEYSRSLPLGKRIARHLKRVKFAVSSNIALEATRSVMAMVVRSQGWTITTPLNLLDAERFLPDLDIHPFPFVNDTRSIYLVARGNELGRLPQELAVACRAILREKVQPQFRAVAPHLPFALTVMPD